MYYIHGYQYGSMDPSVVSIKFTISMISTFVGDYTPVQIIKLHEPFSFGNCPKTVGGLYNVVYPLIKYSRKSYG